MTTHTKEPKKVKKPSFFLGSRDITEEFYQWTDDGMRDVSVAASDAMIADWWVNKISEILQSRDREIVGIIESMKIPVENTSPNDDAVGSEQRGFGWNKALSDLKDRIQNHD